MKKIMFVLLLMAGTAAVIEARPFRAGVNFDYFYTQLSPYGEWIEVDYGVYAWRPDRVHRSWRPYSQGYWSHTHQGWYWNSYEPFGWAVYHYGRWYNDDYYGWIWIPDNEWGPSWVEWRYNGDYIGWAPLPPYAHFSVGLGIHFTHNWHAHYSHWNFVRYSHFTHIDVHNYFLNPAHNYGVYRRTKYRTNYHHGRNGVINRGVDRSYIERRSGRSIATREIRTVNRFEDYKKSRGTRDNVTRAYRPTEDEIRRTTADRRTINVKKSDRRSTLRSDKIIKRGFEEVDRTRVKRTVPDSRDALKRNVTREYQDSRENAVKSRRDNPKLNSDNRDAVKRNFRRDNQQDRPSAVKRDDRTPSKSYKSTPRKNYSNNSGVKSRSSVKKSQPNYQSKTKSYSKKPITRNSQRSSVNRGSKVAPKRQSAPSRKSSTRSKSKTPSRKRR